MTSLTSVLLNTCAMCHCTVSVQCLNCLVKEEGNLSTAEKHEVLQGAHIVLKVLDTLEL